jgi:uncharacterized protein YukE
VNTLIATAEGGPALAECYESLKIIGPASNLFSQDASGGWAIAEGVAGGIGAAMDVAEFAIDPIASLGASVAGFLLDYMPPLPDMLDSIAGDPGAVEAKAATWQNVSGRVSDSADDLDAKVRSALAQWSGPAADAYSAFTDALAETLRTLSTMCAGVGGTLQAASAVVSFVRAIVRDVIADLVGKLISWASQVALTAGVGASWVVPQAVTAIGIRVAKVGDWLRRLTSAIRVVTDHFDTANKALVTGVPALRRIAQHLDGAVVAAARDGVEAVTFRTVIESAAGTGGTLNKTFDAAIQASGGNDG